jgi:hypothetical protein
MQLLSTRHAFVMGVPHPAKNTTLERIVTTAIRMAPESNWKRATCHAFRRSTNSSLMRLGLPLPPSFFITCPTKKPTIFVFPFR